MPRGGAGGGNDAQGGNAGGGLGGGPFANSRLMRPLVVLALPGMYLFYKYNQYKEQQQEQTRRRVTDRELAQLNHKIDKLLTRLDESEPEMATSQEDECVICVNARATMRTSPCGHRVVCRRCFVKTIQVAVSQRMLPLRCVICRAKVLRLKQTPPIIASASGYSLSSSSSSHPSQSISMYSMASGSSSLSGVSSVSSSSRSSFRSGSSSISMKSSKSGPVLPVRQPTGTVLRRSQHYSMKVRLQDYKEPLIGPETMFRGRDISTKNDETTQSCSQSSCGSTRLPGLPPIVEFQREFRQGKDRVTSSSTRIRCAQKIVTQLETTPLEPTKESKKSTNSTKTSFFRLKPSSLSIKDDKKSPNKLSTLPEHSTITIATKLSNSNNKSTKLVVPLAEPEDCSNVTVPAKKR